MARIRITLALILIFCFLLTACEARDPAPQSIADPSAASAPAGSQSSPPPAVPSPSAVSSAEAASSAPPSPAPVGNWPGKLSGNERLDANVENVLDSYCDPAAADIDNMLAVYNLLMVGRFGYRGQNVDLTDGYTKEKIYELADEMLQTWRGSCEHFAAVNYVFAERLGLSVHLVDGPAFFGAGSSYSDDASGWGAHGWILAEIDGRYYHFDPLYDRYLMRDLAFFMKTDQVFEQNHRWDRDVYPASG